MIPLLLLALAAAARAAAPPRPALVLAVESDGPAPPGRLSSSPVEGRHGGAALPAGRQAPPPGVRRAIELAKRRGWPILSWHEGLPPEELPIRRELVVVGTGGTVGRAVRAILEAGVRDGRGASIRYPLDAVYGRDRPYSEIVSDPVAYYPRFAAPDWAAFDRPEGRRLRLVLQRSGKTFREETFGVGKDVEGRVDLTELAALEAEDAQGAGEPMAVPAAPGELPRSPFSNGRIGTSSEPGLWFGERPTSLGFEGVVTGSQGDLGRVDLRYVGREREDGPLGEARVRQETSNGLTRRGFQFGLGVPNHGVTVGFSNFGGRLFSRSLAKVAYTNRLERGGFLNEATVKGGYLFGERRYGNSSFEEPAQPLFGLGNTASYGWNVRSLGLLAEAGGSAVFAKPYDAFELDHTRIHGGLQASLPLTDSLSLTGDVRHRVIAANTERYFFLDRRSDDQGLAALSYAAAGWRAGVLGGLHVVRDAQSSEERRKGGLWVAAWRLSLTGLASLGKFTNEYTASVAADVGKGVQAELVGTLDRSTRGDWERRFVGLAFRKGFGGGFRGLPDERRARGETRDIYGERFYEDHRLSQERWASSMDSVRKANEWAGSNLTWVTGDENKWSRFPDETYPGRAGDCDEQAWLVSKTLNDNPAFRARGGQAHILDYWSGFGGHGVSLIEEGGKVYVNEYGVNYRVDVAPNASLEDKARAALEQVGPYLALKPAEGKPVDYGVWGTDAPGDRWWGYFEDGKTGFLGIPSYRSKGRRPPVELGVGALLNSLDEF